MERWPHQKSGVEQVICSINAGDRHICLTSPTGGGKCFARGTSVLRFDGRVVPVESVCPGDLLMGPDSRPRKVLGVTSGTEEMFRVSPTRYSDPYVVNKSHILSLKMTGGSKKSCGISDGTIINMQVADYLKATKTFRHCAKGYRVGVEFPARPVTLDPYLLGVWLGDGTSRRPDITTADPEIVSAIHFFAGYYGVDVKVQTKPDNKASTYSLNNGSRWRTNEFLELLTSLQVIGNKHIPHEYKCNSREVRLKVLAGLIDTDGHLHRNGNYDLVFEAPRLAHDAAFLARSLGFSVSIRACDKTCVNNGVVGSYWRLSVVGDVSEIPVRILRKASGERLQKKQHLMSGISVESIGVGEYYGFQVDGDSLFLLGDFTVAHNSVMIVDLLEWAAAQGWPAILYTNRKLLTEQMIGTLTKHGVPFGVRAAGFSEMENFDAPIQIASLQTEAARVHKTMKWLPHRSKLVLIDEAHLQKSAMALKSIAFHDKNDAACVGITATPIGISKLYPDRLIVAGTTSELRACGALVPCDVYAPSEFDTKSLKPQKTGEFSLNDIRKYIWSKTIYGHVYDHWKILNPDARPALLFAPGVAEAVGFAEKFHGEGVGAASIDGEDVWVDGKTYSSSREAREEVLARFKAGEIKVLCNRFVLREGIDLPDVYHGILATPIGSVVSYVQIVGRILRASPATPSVILQDHGGNWWRHGSPNADRDWASVYDVQERLITERRQENMREKKEPEPIVCAKCGAVRMKGPDCHQCGFRQDKKSRMVIQKDGKLKSMEGDIFKPRTVKMLPNTEQIWTQCYMRAKNSKNGMTFKQAQGLFFYENHYWPPHNLPFMPTEALDWERKVRDVPREKLIPKQQMEAAQ